MKVESLRDRVYNYYLRHRSEGKMFTINYFKTELIHRSTVYRVIKRAENDSGHARVAGSERKAKIMTKSNIQRLKSMFDHKDGVSQRQAARRFHCSQPYI